MACNSLSAKPALFNTPLVSKSFDGKPAVLSTEIAHKFGKKHAHICRDIANLLKQLPEIFGQSNFGLATYTDAQGKSRQCYLLTRDAFTLLVMGFTGKKALYWKLAYIEAFNAMEAEITKRESRLSLDAGYHHGYDVGRASALEAVNAESQKAARTVWKLSAKDKRLLRSCVRYRQMGLGIQAIAKLLDIHGRRVTSMLQAAHCLGFIGGGK